LSLEANVVFQKSIFY